MLLKPRATLNQHWDMCKCQNGTHHSKVEREDAVVASSMLSVVYRTLCIDHGLHKTMLIALRLLMTLSYPLGNSAGKVLHQVGSQRRRHRKNKNEEPAPRCSRRHELSGNHRQQNTKVSKIYLHTQAVDYTQE